jgi:hypothetical protein
MTIFVMLKWRLLLFWFGGTEGIAPQILVPFLFTHPYSCMGAHFSVNRTRARRASLFTHSVRAWEHIFQSVESETATKLF